MVIGVLLMLLLVMVVIVSVVNVLVIYSFANEKAFQSSDFSNNNHLIS